MDKIKRIGSIVCLAVIAASYLITVISVFMKSEDWINYLYASIFVTVVFPIILYGLLTIARIVKKDDE